VVRSADAIPVPASAAEPAFMLKAEAAIRPPRPGVVLCHPHPAFGGRMDTPLILALADGCERAGLSWVRFNFRGLEGSGGRPTGGLLEHEDVSAVMSWMRDRGVGRLSLCSYSFGALMSAKALSLGEVASAHVMIGLPTTIIGHDPERVAVIERALDRALPSLIISGDHDQFCELPRVHAWVASRSQARLEVLKGEGHFFGLETTERLVGLAVGFIEAAGSP
jgi:alpha/beta superfamily hydrolase